jgi:phenylpropionate dioxygenase-like ring-hydroxylating dioxygenase large terminal subunit
MFDFAERLRENAHLMGLLSHYAQVGSEDRTAWQHRLMEMEGIEAKHLTTLHGELIAFDWIEQHTGQAHFGPDGTVGACYRITRHGLREYRRILGIEVFDETSEIPAQPQSRLPRKRNKQNEAPAVATAE